MAQQEQILRRTRFEEPKEKRGFDESRRSRGFNEFEKRPRALRKRRGLRGQKAEGFEEEPRASRKKVS